jgi:hypothetical protein
LLTLDWRALVAPTQPKGKVSKERRVRIEGEKQEKRVGKIKIS